MITRIFFKSFAFCDWLPNSKTKLDVYGVEKFHSFLNSLIVLKELYCDGFGISDASDMCDPLAMGVIVTTRSGSSKGSASSTYLTK